MFTIYLDDKVLYSTELYDDQDLSLTDMSCSIEIGKAGSLSFSVQPTHYLYPDIRQLTSVIRAYHMHKEIFSGRVLSVSVDDYKTKKIQCEGNLTYLLDSAFPPIEETMTVKEFFLLCLATHNHQVEPAKQFKPGIVNAKKANQEENFSTSGYEDTKSTMDSSLIDAYGGYLRTRSEGDSTYLDYIQDYGRVSSQVLEFGQNILEYSEERDATDIFTVLIPIGDYVEASESGLGVKILTTIAPVNNGSTMIDLPTQEVYGRIVKVESFSGIKNPQELYNKAIEYLNDNHLTPPLKISLRAIDLKYFNWSLDMFEVGLKYRVVSKEHNIDTILTCSKIEYKIDDPSQTRLTLEELKQRVGGSSYRSSSSAGSSGISSQMAQTSGGKSGGATGALYKFYSEGDDWAQIQADKINLISGDVKSHGAQLKITKDAIEAEVIRAKGQEGTLESRIKVEAERITAEVKRSNEAEGELRGALEIEANRAALHVTQTKNKILEIDNKIEVNIQGIELSVQKDKVISSINVSPESIKIKSKSIQLTGEGGIIVDGNLAVKGDIRAVNLSIDDKITALRAEFEYIKAVVTSSDRITVMNLRANYIDVGAIKAGGNSYFSTSATVVNSVKLDSPSTCTVVDKYGIERKVVTKYSLTVGTTTVKYLGRS